MSTTTAVPAEAPGRSRRAPADGERRRDAGRSRQNILDAALSEFADKGYAGARVREIARRAGVNTQLISYYFGGKEGLYNELVASWRQREAALDRSTLSFADVVVSYLQMFAERPEPLRMFVWEGLTRKGPRPEEPGAPGGEDPEVTELRERQAAGEIAADLDPGYLALAAMGAVATLVTMPDMVERLCGVRADSDEFVSRFAEQLRRIVRHLGGSRPGD